MPGSRKQSGWEVALLVLILALTLGTRLGHARRGLPYLHHVDEPHTTVQALEMMQSGELNPGRFRYGSLFVYSMVAVDAVHYLWLCRSPDPLTGGRIEFEEIELQTDEAWRWEISHPSFYLWNRGFCALLGSLTVLLVYLVGRRVHPLAGLVGATTLAVTSVHVQSSAMVAPDVPAGFVVFLSVALCVAYMRSKRTGTLVWAFVTCGMALATKYNVAPLLLAPYLALLLAPGHGEATRRPSWLWWGGITITLGTFLLCQPYALLDLPTFLRDVGIEVAHYSLMGHGPHTIEAGLTHLGWILARLAESWTWPVLILALGGLLFATSWRERCVLLAYPACFVFLQAQTVVAFHRNLLSVYPFLAVGLGYAAHGLWRWCGTRKPAAGTAFAGVVAALLAWAGIARGLEAKEVATTPETRTQAAMAVARLAEEHGWKRIGVAENLRVHPIDLARIDAELVVDALPELRAQAKHLDAIVCPATYAWSDSSSWNREHRLDRHQKRVPTVEPIWSVDGAPMELAVISPDPAVRVFVPPYSAKQAESAAAEPTAAEPTPSELRESGPPEPADG